MRFIFGILVGAVLIVAGAYVRDSGLPDNSSQRLVNWSVASDLSGWAIDRAREEWNRLTAK